ncbi:MAG: thiamine biosynthesis protein ThiS [Actinobacteria bacterium QS_8_72_14]|nr:MAG: thiamine biosynthesis protein ThiS [Actinobacteria bacterium QS_8_72_14]
MRLVVNGADRDVAAGTTVTALVEEVAGDRRQVAVAINGDIVERNRWDELELDAGDHVEIVAAAQGGG